jgi:hypothetical protein
MAIAVGVNLPKHRAIDQVPGISESTFIRPGVSQARISKPRGGRETLGWEVLVLSEWTKELA